jgi:hypothetical protein
MHRDPVHGRSEYFRSAGFWISVPASVALQLDGSHVKLKDYLAEPDRAALGQAENPEAVLVTYRFEALPRALRVAIPRTYDGALFGGESGKESEPGTRRGRAGEDGVGAETAGSGDAQRYPEEAAAVLEQGRKVTVIAGGPDPERKGAYIVAGQTSDKKTGATKPVAVRVDHDTRLVSPAGVLLPPAAAAKLAKGSVIVVEGKRSKRGVIRGKRVVVP